MSVSLKYSRTETRMNVTMMVTATNAIEVSILFVLFDSECRKFYQFTSAASLAF